MAEVDRDALPGKELDRGIAERPNAPIFFHRRCVGGVVKVDLDNLESSLWLRVVTGKPHESGGNGRERKNIFPALPLPTSTNKCPFLPPPRRPQSHTSPSP